MLSQLESFASAKQRRFLNACMSTWMHTTAVIVGDEKSLLPVTFNLLF